MSYGRAAKPGDEIGRGIFTARRVNAWDQAGKEAERVKQAQSRSSSPSLGIVQVLNDSGAPFAPHELIEIGDPYIATDGIPQLVAFRGTRPANPEVARTLAITQDLIGDERIGPAVAFGVSIIQSLEVVSETHTRAIAAPDGKAKTAEDGPLVVLWAAASAGSTGRGVVLLAQDYKASPRIYGALTGATPDGPNRWIYTFEQVEAGEGGIWEQVEGGISGNAINTAEVGNGDSGIQGNGVDLANLEDIDFEIVPLGAGAVFAMTGPVDDVWFFSASNLVDGVCGL